MVKKDTILSTSFLNDPLSTVIWYVVLQQCHDLKESSELFKHRTARLKACFNEK